MVGTRDTPPSIQDGPLGYEPDSISNFESPDAPEDSMLSPVLAAKLGREVWEASTNWINSGRRARWNDSLRSFQNLHPSGSKYLSGDYRFRSQLFRPKTRTMVRRDEAATASAFFCNEDVVSITANDDDDPHQQASAEILKELLQYRLANAEGDNRIPWFLTLVGARQDADVMGICVSKVGWTYEERFVKTEMRPVLGPDGMPQWNDLLQAVDMESIDIYEKLKDHPFIDLISPENFRFEPGCDWRNVVGSSPYLIEMVPVYIGECLERMEPKHGAPAEWLKVSTSSLRGATDLDDDVTRRARETGRVPGKSDDSWKPRDFDIAWTRCNIIRWGGEDWYFRTIASTGELLELPRPLSEVYLHGQRPYVVGSVVVETHKTYPSSKVELTTDLQRMANQDMNSRFDAVMLSLQPRQFVREGSGQDVNDLRTFMPGKVVQVNAKPGEPLTNTVTWDRPPPVDGASFQEQDRINLDWDDLTGAFTNSSQAASQIAQPSATGMHILSGEASGLNEYELRVFSETFVEPTLRLLIKTEQAYETDEIVLALAGKRANLLQRFGVDQITNDLLSAGATVRCNVGMGATNPQLKLRNFATGAQILGSMFGQSAAMGANFSEVSKELFGLLGYKDGARFFQPDFDPRVAMLQQQLQKAQGKGGASPDDQSKVQAAQITAQARIQERQIQGQTDANLAQMDYQTKLMAEQADNERVRMKIENDQGKMQQGFVHDHDMANHQFVHELHNQANAFAADSSMANQQQQHDKNMASQSFVHDTHIANQGFAHEQEMQAAPAAQPAQAAPAPSSPEPESVQALAPVAAPAAPQPVALTVSTAKPSEDAEMDRHLMELLNQSMMQNQVTAQSISEAMNQLASVVHDGNVRVAQALVDSNQSSAEHGAKLSDAIDSLAYVAHQQAQATHAAAQQPEPEDKVAAALSALSQVVQRNSQVSEAILGAMNRKKKVIRGKDGKIEGVE